MHQFLVPKLQAALYGSIYMRCRISDGQLESVELADTGACWELQHELIGKTMRLQGLQKRPELNGKIVHVLGCVSHTNRLQVRVHGGSKTLSVHAPNLGELNDDDLEVVSSLLSHPNPGGDQHR